MSTLDEAADQLLLKWAAREAGLIGEAADKILRDEGIITKSRSRLIRSKEIPLSIFEKTGKARKEVED